MRAILSTICVLTGVVLTSALAETRTTTIYPESLARIEAITSYCGEVDPKSMSLYLSKLTGLTRGHSEDEIQRARTTSSYRSGWAQADKTLSRATQPTAIRACSEFLEEK